MNMLQRLFAHTSTGHLLASRAFPAKTLPAIEQAVKACEHQHPGEIRFVVEPALHLRAVLQGLSARERAVQVFSQLRVWDTAHNNGVLVYVLMADRAVEIVADRGVAHGHVPQSEWDAVCRLMESHFRERRFEVGAVAGVRAVAAVLARYPAGPKDVGNEQSDAPVILP
jgi:uncharacterized membrane protein YgcG